MALWFVLFVISGRYRNPAVRPAWYRARQRTITPAQKRIERALWPLYGLRYSHDAVIYLDNVFQAPAGRRLRVLEIGCGTGEALVTLAGEKDGPFPWLNRPAEF